MNKETRDEVRGALGHLDRFFANPLVSNIAKQAVWDILTALRGPDIDTYGSYKSETTAVIRRTAFPTGKRSISNFADVAGAGTKLARSVASHFGNHISRAADALRALGRKL